MTGTQKLMIRNFFSYIGKNNKSNIAIRAHLSSLVVEWRDLVGPDHVTTFSIPKFSGGRSSDKFCRCNDCIRVVALSKTRLHRNVLKYRNGSDQPLKDKTITSKNLTFLRGTQWQLLFCLTLTPVGRLQMKQARNRSIKIKISLIS